MQPFTAHTGRAVPLRRNDVDTDQIIPSDYLKRVSRTGFADGLFAGWRAEGDFVLDDPRYHGATILLAGSNFGGGSSREHAVWALQDWGFRAVVAAGFGDIFRGNATKNGLLPVSLPDPIVQTLIDLVERAPLTQITVDLVDRELRSDGLTAGLEIDDYTRWRLMEGLDDIALTLRHQTEIAEYERHRPRWFPKISPSGPAV
jgi:3-isopropylmalate/(R)-2-methylmalate dehydratase small subunit